MLIDQLDGLNIIPAMAIPMILLVVLEWVISARQKKGYYDSKDTVSSTVIGLVNVGISALLKLGMFTLILFFYNMVSWSIPITWWSFILCIVSIDFCRYWAHRLGHVNRFWWATHVTHHNSKQYNWSTSFRLGWTQHIKLIFFIPIAIMGFDPVQFFICHQLAVLYQFWIHTQYIDKLPKFIEFIFTTPSHHRVHHGTNVQYMDKNYGSTFIIWDRMFGTFEPEVETVVYGITKEVNAYDPISSNFHEWKDIIHDVRKSHSLKEAYAMVFTSPAKLEKVKSIFKIGDYSKETAPKINDDEPVRDVK